MKVICISGKAQHGKDTSAQLLKDLLQERGKSVLVTHYADLLKYICRTFFSWDGKKDERGRTLLQYVGTDTIRHQRPDYWVEFIAGFLKMFQKEWDYVLIPDCRFPNEIDYMKDAGFDVTHIRVKRTNFVSVLTDEQQRHPSETALDDVKPDYILYNDCDLEALNTNAVNIVSILDGDKE